MLPLIKSFVSRILTNSNYSRPKPSQQKAKLYSNCLYFKTMAFITLPRSQQNAANQARVNTTINS